MADLSACGFCRATENLADIAVAPREDIITLCAVCRAGVERDIVDAPHRRCLSDAIWSPDPAVQVTAWRLLTRFSPEPWARDPLEIAYLEADTLAWARTGMLDPDTKTNHRDSKGVALSAGDTVTPIKDLNVKGAGFTVKRGTAVRGISLVQDNETQTEGV